MFGRRGDIRVGDSAFLQAVYQLQESPLAAWLTQSSWALFFLLIVHTASMGFLAGTGSAVALRVLGIGRSAPLSRYVGLLSLMKAFLAVAAISGALLLVGYPGKYLTNPVFYGKLGIVALALLLTAALSRGVVRGPGAAAGRPPGWAAAVAAASIAAWAAAILAGRLLPYTQQVTVLTR